MKTSYYKLLKKFLIIIIFFPICLLAQNRGSMKGIIKNAAGESIPNATIRFDKKQYSINADNEGEFFIKSIPQGSYEISISAVGYNNYATKIIIKSGENVFQKMVLQEQMNELNETVIIAKSETKKAAEQSYQVSVIDAKKLHNTTLNVAHALNNVPGIRVKESGGLGSDVDFSLNGFSGNQVKFFIDGIPLESMGNSFTINNIPINLAERIEVYKGVVPVHLGSDALGGAINIVTNSGKTNYLDASYSTGSFNTHKTSVNFALNSKNGFALRINAFQNYSKNNYWVETETPINEFGQLEKVRVRRFHDRYRNEMFMLGLGVRNKTWADQLMFGFDFGQYGKELQNGVTMEDVYGERNSKGTTILPSIKYLKRDLFIKGLDLNLSGNFNLGYDQTTDTVNKQYNWKGEVIREFASRGAERSRMNNKYRNNIGTFTANLSYIINEKNAVVLNNNFTTFKRVNKDLLGESDDFFNKPSSLGKNVLGLSYRYDYSEKFTTSIFGKHYSQYSRSFMNVNMKDNPTHDDYGWSENSFTALGYGFATSYFVTTKFQIRASYEHGIRVPTSGELFGNMNTLTGNIDLKPENSENMNLGFLYNLKLNKSHFLSFDGAVLYRYSKDFIRPSLARNMQSTIQQMVNLRDVDNLGLEGNIRYRYKNKFNTGINLSYQNLINRTKYEGGSNDIVSIVYKDRIPNMPYLFGNADASYSINKPFGMDGTLTFGYQLLYVHSYYEGWPSLGSRSSKITIPTQWNHNANLIYTCKGGKYNITLEALNLTDALLYDHFNLQKPSRAFNVKFRYFLFNNK